MSAAPSTSPDIGLLLDGRYRVEELIARGGMATVYRGHDERLDRAVALKIMHPHLASDPVFVSRFTREARSAARLSDPHVVPVHDQGEDAGRVYLAMELVEGGTLRDLLKAEGALTIRESLRIAIAMAQALRAAHAAGIVHRDIKPENILLGADATVKVADFGLARAVGSTTSSVSATLLGTVAYISPEVVTRGHTDERSDIYSFGVVLYEMLTGSQPYTGELPVHIAFQHVHEDMPAPSHRAPSVPRALDSLVTWCCARNPTSRPRDARELLRALNELRADLSDAVLDAPPLAIEAHGTQDVPHVTAALEVEELRGDAPAHTFLPSPVEDAQTDPEHEDEDEQERSAERAVRVRPPRMRRARHLAPGARTAPRSLRLLTGLSALALVAGGGWAGAHWYLYEGPGGERTVPVLAGTSLTDAEAALSAEDLSMRTQDTFSESVPAGHVISTTPVAASTIQRGSDVTVLVSRGEQTFPVPDVEGRSLKDARKAVEAARLTLVEDDPVYDAKVARGDIIEQSPQGTALPRGGEVHVVVSRGVRPITIPDVTSKSAEAAESALKAQGFAVTRKSEHSSSVDKGSVISQSPASGSAQRGATVTIVVSSGPEMVSVPDVFKKSESSARATLEKAGFTVRVEHDKGDPVFKQVYEQSPASGKAAKGSTVTIKVF